MSVACNIELEKCQGPLSNQASQSIDHLCLVYRAGNELAETITLQSVKELEKVLA